ncbi:MAG: hypothetical protein RL514_3905 [Verrucomicrobiota bacterium]|jgi:hypothetical protein
MSLSLSRIPKVAWRVAAGLLAVALFPLLWRMQASVGLDDNVRLEVVNRLKLDVSRTAWAATGAPPGGLPNRDAAAQFGKTAQALERLELVESEAKQGLLGARYLRVKFRLPEVEIPVGEDVRYYELGFNPLLGWTVKRGSSAFFFNLGL